MNDRFSPSWSVVRAVVEKLIQDIAGAEQWLIEAFGSVSRHEASTANQVKQVLGTHVVTGNTTPWVLYDTITALFALLPQTTRHQLATTIRIPTERSYEYLRVTTDGRWQVSWILEPDLADVDDREVALDWYKPSDRDAAPIVPTTILDYIAGAIDLLRADLTLPAGAIMSAALESALWDALAAVNISSRSLKVTYATANWKIRRRSKYYVIEVEGAEKDPTDLAAVIGTDVNQVFSVAARRTAGNRSATESILELSIDNALVDFLTTRGIEKEEEFPERGLTSAIERGRRTQLQCLQFLPSNLDMTLIALRNNVVHLPSQGTLHTPIPLPSGGALTSIDELRQQTTLVRSLLRYVVNVINTVYTTPPEVVQVQ